MSNTKKKKFDYDDGFIVYLLFKVFHDFFPLFDPFRWARKIGWYIGFKRHHTQRYRNKVKSIVGDNEEDINDYMKHDLYFVDTYSFPELWALSHLIFSYIFFHCIDHFNKTVALVVGIYSALRVFELFVYQVNVLFFDQLAGEFNNGKKNKTIERPTRRNGQTKYYIKSAQRTVILLLFNIFEYVFQFALMYKAFNIFYGFPSTSITIVTSFELFMNTYSDLGEVAAPLLNIIYIEILIGLFMNVVCLAYFIGVLPTVSTQREIMEMNKDKNKND